MDKKATQLKIPSRNRFYAITLEYFEARLAIGDNLEDQKNAIDVSKILLKIKFSRLKRFTFEHLFEKFYPIHDS